MKRTITLLLTASAGFFASAQVDAITDGGFEGGPSAGTWTESSTNFSTLYCDAATCSNCGGPCVPNTGVWYIWFGGVGAKEIGVLSQNVTLPAAATQATLSFYLRMALIYPGHDLDTLTISMGTDQIFLITNKDTATYGFDYTLVDIDVSSYCDGTTRPLTFYSYQHGVEGADTTITNILVDDVELVYQTPAGITRSLLSDGISIYPSPASARISIDVSMLRQQGLQVEMIDFKGSVVSSHEVPAGMTGTLHIPVAHLPQGPYVLQINDGFGVISRTVAVAR